MSTLTPSSVDASTRLLRILASLAAQLDPVKGIKATTLKALVEDVEDIGKGHGESLSSEVQQLLSTAASSCSCSTTSTVSYLDCLPFHATLARALPLLLVLPVPRPSPFLSLPAELVAHIVGFCQTDDLRLRQNTNLALSRTCRLLHRAVSPILDAEMHLFTPGQLERAADEVELVGFSRRSRRPTRAITTFSCDLGISDITRQSDGRWAGRHLVPLTESFGTDGASPLKHLRMHFRADEAGSQGGSVQNSLLRALGATNFDWQYLFSDQFQDLSELWYPVAGLEYDLQGFLDAVLSQWDLTRVHLGQASLPYYNHPNAILDYFDPRREKAVQPFFASFTVFAAPFLTLYPSDALKLFHKPTTSPPLQHLELSIHYCQPEHHLGPLVKVLTFLAPTLRHLSLRLKGAGPAAPGGAQLENDLLEALRPCQHLTTLELGGYDCDGQNLRDILEALPALRHFTLLPAIRAHANAHTFSLLAVLEEFSAPHLESFTCCTSRFKEDGPKDRFGEAELREWMEKCEEQGIEAKVEWRESEIAWLRLP
ncbi:hypothetical protein JCM8097_008806 [Rhodosporidiobolus ruineniae]